MQNRSTVLIVDDDPSFRTIVRFMLEKMDYAVLEAGDVTAGLALAVKDVPQLIILDMVMPVKSGQDFLVDARTNEVIKHIPVLVCSGRDSELDARRCSILGAAGYISKPIDIEEFTAKVNKAAGRVASRVNVQS